MNHNEKIDEIVNQIMDIIEEESVMQGMAAMFSIIVHTYRHNGSNKEALLKHIAESWDYNKKAKDEATL